MSFVAKVFKILSVFFFFFFSPNFAIHMYLISCPYIVYTLLFMLFYALVFYVILWFSVLFYALVFYVTQQQFHRHTAWSVFVER